MGSQGPRTDLKAAAIGAVVLLREHLGLRRTRHPRPSIEREIPPPPLVAWIERHVPLLLAKPPVQVILWNQLSDAAPHHYPHGGLFDAQDQPKPALESLRKIRQQLLSGVAGADNVFKRMRDATQAGWGETLERLADYVRTKA